MFYCTGALSRRVRVGNTRRLKTVECVRLNTERINDSCQKFNNFPFSR
jgi:hypothetical protein